MMECSKSHSKHLLTLEYSQPLSYTELFKKFLRVLLFSAAVQFTSLLFPEVNVRCLKAIPTFLVATVIRSPWSHSLNIKINTFLVPGQLYKIRRLQTLPRDQSDSKYLKPS